ncbi:helix-turn-helix transcriptional regulator [Rugosimonospora acidiphila]|uniref:Helix-turn-helix transcriptional regulator n=1 Tax=Rugosimonospora acidiphila TaxID=556531 RepID=A0ABP9RT54_9ACTN
MLPSRYEHFHWAAAVMVSRNPELGAFLRARRARIRPQDVGLSPSDRRRVPGLRREELAQLAGVSLDYYARLEQGRQPTASPAVLGAVARVLQLSADERSHLHTLAGLSDRERLENNSSSGEAIDPRTQRVFDLLDGTPAIVCGRYVDIIAANDAACFLFGTDFKTLPPTDRNSVQWFLRSPLARELYGEEWENAVAEMIGMLRLDAGRQPDTPRLREIVGRLERESSLFRRLWQEHQVSRWLHDRKTLNHPSLGPAEFVNEAITVQGVPEQTIYVMVPSAEAEFRRALQESLL